MNTAAWTLLLLAGAALAAEDGTRDRERGRQRRKRPRAGGRRRSEHDPLERSSRGLVPQLLANYSAPSLAPAHTVSCSAATLACAKRDGCGSALEQYLVSCGELVTGPAPAPSCSQHCRLSLIALLSTPEGARLMQCECEDSACRQQKARIEPCRAEVTWSTRADTLVSCTAATWICGADASCATALRYYHANCRKMFSGEKCGRRCKNSLDILLRQQAAAKLATCYCEGSEDFECVNIRRNTDVLCFGKKDPLLDTLDTDNSLDSAQDEAPPARTAGASGHRSGGLVILSFLLTFAVAELGAAVTSGVVQLGQLVT